MALRSKSRRNAWYAAMYMAVTIATLMHATSVRGATAAPLTSLRAIHALSNAQASHQLPVSFEATVTYYRPYERTMFVQDGDLAIYVQPKDAVHVSPGDRVLIKGTTHESFRPYVSPSSITVVGHDGMPAAAPATFDQLIHGEFDCRLVTVRASVRSVDVVQSSDQPSVSIKLRSDGGPIEGIIDGDSITVSGTYSMPKWSLRARLRGDLTARCR